MSDNYNSITVDDGWQPWEENFDSCFVGFANRDKFNTETHARIPFNINVVGEPWNSHFKTSLADGGSFSTYSNASTPPLMTLKVAPVVAAVKHNNPSDPTDIETIDTDAWQVLFRDLNYINRVYNIQFEPISLQFCNFVLSEVAAHVAHLLRAMDVAYLEENPNSLIAHPTRMLAAMGFRGLGDKYSELVDFINIKIIARLNSRIWFWKFMPSIFRRASMFSKIYSGEDTARFDCELYMLLPEVFMKPGYDAETSTYKATRTSIPQYLKTYAEMISDAISWLLADDDFVNIQTAMQAIIEKDKSLANGVELTSNMFSYYPRSGRTLFTTYSAGMLVAIHNATIADGIYPSDLTEVVTEGERANILQQTFTMDSNYYTTTNATPESLRISAYNQWIRAKNVMDFPAIVKADDWQSFVFASMWTITSYPEQPVSEMEISPKCLGTEIIRSCSIWTFANRQGGPTELEISGIFPIRIMNSSSTPYSWSVDEARKIAFLAQFSYAPLIPLVLAREADYANPQLVGFVNDLTHVAIADFHTLESVKKQFTYNAIGYPMQVSETGEFMGARQLAESAASNVSADVSEAPLKGSGTMKSSRRAQKSGGEE